MRYLKVAAAALNQTPLDWEGNRRNILAAIAQARAEGAQVLCLPELCISGYGCEDAFHGEALADTALEMLRSIVPETRGLAVSLGLPLIHGSHLFNVAALAVDGRLAGFYAKKVLAGYGVYYEPRWFQPWPEGEQDTVRVDGEDLPIGDLVFDLRSGKDSVRLGFEICEDAWNRGSIAHCQSRDQADILLNPSASHFAFAKYGTVRSIVAEGSRLSQAVYLYANLLGNESGRLIFDGCCFVASNGRVVTEGPRFSFQPTALLSAVVDLRGNRLDRRRLNYPLRRLLPGADKGQPLRDAVPVPYALQPSTGQALTRRHTQALASQHEEFTQAVALGLWDYLRKSRSRGYIVSLSGGVDSATVAVLCAAAARLALAELGASGVLEALAHIPDLRDALNGTAAGNDANATGSALVRRLLFTVYQGSEHSSETTRSAAAGVAEALGARHAELAIGPLVQAYEALAEGVIGRELTWEQDDLARQNIQARVRSPGIWLLANLEGRLLLSTSNRSEVGVGYATMDGDTSGGLAPIAGANKSFLREWLRWMETAGPAPVGPVPALAAVNAQQPTAELRPGAQVQEDEKDLMPYLLLDAIEQAAIRDRMSPVEVWRSLRVRELPGLAFTPAELAARVATFFRLWSQSQWKRERLAPSFHLDDENLDPPHLVPLPILQGGFAHELAELDAAVAGEG